MFLHAFVRRSTPLLLLVVLAASAVPQGIEQALLGDFRQRVAHTSPRDTATAFVESMPQALQRNDAEALARAVSCLNLEGIAEEERDTLGPERARQLYAIFVEQGADPSAFPRQVDGDTYVWRQADSGSIAVQRYDDKWLFRRETVAALPALYAELAGHVAEQPVILPTTALPNPRATLRFFLEKMANGTDEGRSEALRALELPPTASGTDTAFLLHQILGRFPLPEPHDQRDGPPWQFQIPGTGHVITIDRGDDGQWRFAAWGLENLYDVYEVVKGRPALLAAARDQSELYSIRLRLWVRKNARFLLNRRMFLENWQWMGLLVTIFVGMAFSRITGWGLAHAIRRVFNRATFELSGDLEKGFLRPIRIAIMAWVWLLGLSILGLPANIFTILHTIAQVISAVAGIWAFYRLTDVLGSYLAKKTELTETRFDDLLVPLVTRTLKVFIIAFGTVFVAETLDLPLTGLLASVGLGGLAFALAAKETVSNLFGSITIILDRPFQIGDWVVMEDVEGTVEIVGFRSTRVRTFYNSLVTVPNSKLISATVDNLGARRYRRFKTVLAVEYGTPPERIEAFCEGIRALIDGHPYTRKDFYIVELNDFGAHSLDILLYTFFETSDWVTEMRARHNLCLDTIRLARKLGVGFAFPTQTIHLQHNDDPEWTMPGPLPEKSGDPVAAGRKAAEAVMALTQPQDGAEAAAPELRGEEDGGESR